MSKSKKLLSYLGLGSYQETTYRLGDEGEKTTPSIALALASLLSAEETIILATKEAKDKNGELIEQEFSKAGLQIPRFVEVYTAASQDALWKTFQELRNLVRDGRDASIAIDITHAFRSMPFFAGAVVTYARMIDEEHPDVSIYYGAFEAKDSDGVTPIWDLGTFIDVIDWTRRISLFMDSGNASELAEASKKMGRSLKKEWSLSGKKGEMPVLDEFAKSLQSFGNDLTTLRTGSLLLGKDENSPSTLKNVLDTAEKTRRTHQDLIPPVAEVTEKITERFSNLKTESLADEEGLNALIELAKLYNSMGRYAEAMATMREAWVNLACKEDELCRPGQKDCDSGQREERARPLNLHSKAYMKIRETRNDIEHAGYRRSPSEGRKIVDKVASCIEDLKEQVPNYFKEKVFVNISNHPSDSWPKEQLAAAYEKAGKIVDIPFPAVSPEADEGAIKEYVDRVMDKLPLCTSHAMVSGEYVTTFQIVKELQKRSIECYAARTKRLVVKEEDGVKTSHFEFRGFRQYPNGNSDS